MHRQGWGIEIVGRQVTFIPPPQIDPDQIPIAGGLDALDVPDLHAPPPPGSWDDREPDGWSRREAEAFVRELEAAVPEDARHLPTDAELAEMLAMPVRAMPAGVGAG